MRTRMLSLGVGVTLLSAAFTDVCAAASYSAAILADNPVAYFRLEELPGAEAILDSTANHFDGTISIGEDEYPKLGQPGIETNSVAFNGGAGSRVNISIPFHEELNPKTAPRTGTPFTAEAWVQASSQPSDYSIPVSSFGRYVAGDPNYADASGWNFYQSPGPGSFWILNMKPGVFAQASTVPIELFKWYHLAVTYDGTTARFFVDGVQRVTSTGAFIPNPTEPLYIGSGPTVGFLPFKGNVDDVAVYGSALTAEQLKAHYDLGTNSIRAVDKAPSIVNAPVEATVFAGKSVTFSVVADGTAPLSYQWRKGVTDIPGATTSTYTFVAAPGDDEATYSVFISNSVGNTTSVPVKLTVSTDLNIVNDPFSITRKVGSKAAFRVVADGAIPISYEWFKGNSATPIAGANTDTLWLSDLTLAQDGETYHAKLTNPFFTKNSADATLNVVARETTVPATGYARIVIADKPTAYWRLDEGASATTAVDAVGSFDGEYRPASGTFTFPDGGVPRDSDKALGLTGGATVSVPYALELNPVTGPWSVEAWVQPAALDPGDFHTVFSSMWNQDFGNHIFGWNVYQHAAGVWTLNLFNGGGGSTFVSDFAHNPLVPGNWYHMLITDDLTTTRFFVNGVQVGSAARTASKFAPNGVNGDSAVAGGPVTLGQRSDNAFAPFNGALDEVAFYNYALSPLQAQAHFNNTVSLTIERAGSNAVIKWPFGVLQESAAIESGFADVQSAASPLTVPTTGTKFYRVRVP